MPFTLLRPTIGMLRLRLWVVRQESMFMLKNRYATIRTKENWLSKQHANTTVWFKWVLSVVRLQFLHRELKNCTNLTPGNVPSWLDYELWQGPAPRMPYKEGLIHYNWHWYWHWGTGEALNNGTHEVDVARWGLGVDFPTRVTSVGGRYHYKDDWETPDTQTVAMEYPGGVSLVWESRNSNGRKIEGADRGIIFYGENGSLDTGDDSYKIYDLNGKLVKEVKSAEPDTNALQGRNLASPNLVMDSQHVADFLDAIKNNRRPNCDVETGYKSVLAMQLGNISWRVGRDLNIDSKNGHIVGDKDAQKLWSRTYEKGWEPKI